jgi:hypothetical protein
VILLEPAGTLNTGNVIRREVHGAHVHEDLRTPILDDSSRSLQPRFHPSSPAAGSAPKSQEGR